MRTPTIADRSSDASRRVRRGRARAIAALLPTVMLLGLVAGPVHADSSPYGQVLAWTEDLGSPTGRVFGGNQPIVIYQGQIAYVPGPFCTGFQNGQNDFLYPAADVYIVPTGTVEDYAPLEDVSGKPNTIIAASSGGLFIDEFIGTAGGKFPPTFEQIVAEAEEDLPGLIGEGTYDVVYDECQDGKFQPTIDAVFSGAIVVDFAGNPPGFPSITLQAQKLAALAMRKAITKLHSRLEEEFEAGYAAASVADPSVAFVHGLGTRTMFADPGAVTLELLEDQTSHYDGIFADPPDASFAQLTVLSAAPGAPAGRAGGLGAALADAAVELSTEDRVAEALLHAMERYQGADAAGDSEWALAQARAMGRHAAALEAQLGETADAVAALRAAVVADATSVDAGAAELASLAADVAAGDDLAFVRAARNAGLSDTELAAARDRLLAADWAHWDHADVNAAIDELTTANADLAAVAPGFADAMADAVAFMEADPDVPEPFAVADAGGPYSGAAGAAVALDATASLGGRLPIAGYSIEAYEWDLDGDGSFDDATGATPSVTFDRAYHGLIGVRVTNGLGARSADVAYVRADITDANTAPVIGSPSPAQDPEVVVGTAQPFSIDASDPDGDPVSIAWLVDGAFARDGSGYSWTPAARGPHSIEVIVTDDSGASTTRSWLAIGRAADGDSDGWNANADCDDGNAAVNPAHAEVPLNGLDDDCNPATSDDGAPPTAAFVVAAPGGGRNVALLDTGPRDAAASTSSAISVAGSATFQSNWAMNAALDASTEGASWAASPATLRYGVVRLWGTAPWLVDRVAIMPRVDFQPQRVAAFAVDVSTTGFASESDWTQVLAATAADNATLQSFALPAGPVPARYVRIRLLTNRGDPTYISVSQVKVYSPQESAGSSFTFEDRSTDPDNDLASRLWSFGDGTTATTGSPSHTFSTTGSRTVTLQVTDSRSHVASTSIGLRIVTAPTVTAMPSWAPIDEGGTISTSGTTWSDPDGGRIVYAAWDWGDGTQSVESASPATHRFTVDGTYTVRLTVTDDEEQTGFMERTVIVRNVAPGATLPNRTVIGGVPSTFGGAPTDPVDALTCSWDFGDGSATVASCANQPHAYPAPAAGAPDATYTQTFRVSDDDTTTTRTATITVTSILADRLVSDGLPFTFELPAVMADVTGIKTCSWSFGDGSATATGCAAQRHAYPAMSPGAADSTYPLRVTVTVGASTAVLGGTVTTRTVAHLPVYHADFESALGAEWAGTYTREPVQGYAGYGGVGLLLRTGATSAAPLRLTLTGLPAHTGVSMRFILAVIDSWDGSNCSAGPDTLTIRIDGVNRLSNVFENSFCGLQSYIPPPNVALARHLDFGFAGNGGYFTDSAYALGFDPTFTDIPHTASTLTIEWFAGGVWQGINDESFGLDNLDVVLSGVQDVNHAPTVDAGGPYAVVEGTSVPLTASGADADADALAYAWDLDADGQFDDATGASVSLTPDDGPATITVAVRATDTHAASGTDTATVTVQNALPSAILAAPVTVGEGAAIQLALTNQGDPSGPDTIAGFSYAFDCGFGAGFGAWGTTPSASCTSGDDDVDPTVGARIRDKDGGVKEYTWLVAVTNSPPGGTFGATSPIDEGGSSTLAWTGVVDPSATDAAALRYSFACDGLASSLTGSWATAVTATSTTCAFDDNGDLGVAGRVIDPDNGSQTTGAGVTVRNVPPTATLSAPTSLDEGASFAVSLGSATDVSAADRAAGYTYAFDCGNGFAAFAAVSSATCTADDDGSLTVGGKVRDKDGGVSTYTAAISVRNLPPTVSASNDGPGPWGVGIPLRATTGDPSPTDRASLTIEWDLDADGAYDDASGAAPSPSFDRPGSYPAAVRACDDHVCTTAMTTVSVTKRETSLTLGGDASGAYSDPAGVTATIRDRVANAGAGGLSVTVTIGTQSAADASNGSGVARPSIVLDQAAGTKSATASFAGTTLYEASSASGSYAVVKEDATLAYTGDTLVTGTAARLAASVAEVSDTTPGDITRALVAFDVYTGATSCGSGTPTTMGPVPVVDTAPVGDGIGTAEIQLATPAEQIYCIVPRVVPASNQHYRADPGQDAVLTVISSTGKFATGGGWIVDPDTKGHGNFGFTARFTRTGSPKGQAVYVWRATHNGQPAVFIVKSAAISGLSFADETGNGTFPWRATITGKATLRINRASDGSELVTDGNATFTLVAVDGTGGGAGSDRFALRVLDKTGAAYKLAGSWAGSTYTGGLDLSGGNVKVHME